MIQRRLTVLTLPLLFAGYVVAGEDWPTFQHDVYRSARTAESLDAEKLAPAWTYRSPHPPQQAWAGSAKWDAYAGIRGLRSMRDYDPVFSPIAVDDDVYFGSSADDSIHCLDAKTGKTRWLFTVDAPIRIAPTYADGALYFGSDDGFAYKIDAKTGSLHWKFSPAPVSKQILNNGRFISLWPCRTGVLVDSGTAYFGASMLPWKESYLCAVDVATGRPEGPGRYVSKHAGQTMEGALLATKSKLFSPQGRVAPLLFDRATGASQGGLEGGGGSFVLVTSDEQVLHGPGNKVGWITQSNAGSRAKLATYPSGNAVVVAGDTAYLLTDITLSALDRSTRKPRWQQSCAFPFAMILAGDVLYLGGEDGVAAVRAKDGKTIWTHPVEGKAKGLVVAQGNLLVSTDEGLVYAFRVSPTGKSIAVSPKAPVKPTNPPSDTSNVVVGPWLRFLGQGRAEVRWETDSPAPSILEYGTSSPRRRIEDKTPKTKHRVVLEGLKKDALYQYAVKTPGPKEEQSTLDLECDTFFDYTIPHPSGANGSSGDAEQKRAADLAQKLLREAGVSKGMALVLGAADARLMQELVRRSDLRVVAVDSDVQRVREAQDLLLKSGDYGVRVAVHVVGSLDRLPLTGCFANLIIAPPRESGDLFGDEVRRCLAPGGVALIGSPAVHWKRPALADIGEWSHQYGKPDNSAFGGESLAGVKKTGDLEVQWVGLPGPRAQPDRNGRKPSPLAVNGRLFVQGHRRMTALESYNGAVLWSLEIPSLERFNMPRDCGNWCADSERLFVVVRDRCWRINAGSGEIETMFKVPAGNVPGWSWEWGYVAREGDLLFGSSIKQGTSHTNFWGGSGAGWYDGSVGPATYKNCCDNFFAMDPQSGEVRWSYADGVIIHPTITIEGGRIYFVECRNAKIKKSSTRRVGMSELWKDQFLVALDAKTGKKIWERPLDTVDGTVTFYMAAGAGKLVIALSTSGKYHVYAFNESDGKDAWNAEFPWFGKDHGRHMSRPAIVGGKVYVRPKIMDAATGKVSEQAMPEGSCGMYAATTEAFIFRAGNVTIWDSAGGGSTDWARLRPDCWISTVPASGMLLSPEGGGGCSCGSWMETSLGFLPVKHQ